MGSIAKEESLNASGAIRSVGIIMDGNGRWAKARHLPRTAGHRQGAKVIERALSIFREYGVRYVTLYAFSTENWKRPKEEVDAIMALVERYLDSIIADRKKHAPSFTIRFLGDKSALPESLRKKCLEVEAQVSAEPYVCSIALNYGGRAEIVHAVNELIARGLPVTEENISKHTYTADIPDPDLVIRTGGNFRTSNFLLWQSAYAEYVVLDTLWPDFDRADIEYCIKEFCSRNRRFGGLDKEDER